MKGIYSALLVPFDERGKLNEHGLKQLIHHNINTLKVDGLYVGGTSGENFMLSTDIKKKIFKIVASECRKEKIHIIAHIGSLNIDESIELARYVDELNYDVISSITPFYYNYSLYEMEKYFSSIISATNKNMLIYYFPKATGVILNLDELTKLLNIERIIGLKFTDSNFFLLERLRSHFPHKLMFCGYDEMLLSALVLGIDGAIGSTYNVTGHLAKQLYNYVQENRIKEAYNLQQRMNTISEEILKVGELKALKEILKHNSVDAGFCKPPFLKLSSQEINKIYKVANLNL